MKVTAQNLDYGARWLRDGLHESVQAGAFEAIDADVSEVAQLLKQLKANGRAVTWTPVFVRAASLTLARHPDLHRLVAGNKRINPVSVDICVSIAGESSVTPTIIIEDAANKDLIAIAAEIARRAPEAVQDVERMGITLRRWGWIIPLSILRRHLIRFLLRRIWYRRKISGTFQISCLSQVDLFVPLLFNTAAALGVGRVRERVIARNGAPAVRQVVSLACSIDHSVWNGMDAARFLTALREILESGDFCRDSAVPATAKAS